MLVVSVDRVDDALDVMCVPCGHMSNNKASYTAHEIASLQHVHTGRPLPTPSFVMAQGFGACSPQSTAPITTISY
jgi:hypothetical protein